MARLRFFPIVYDVAGRVVIVAGGGEGALNKLRLLSRSDAVLRVVSPVIEPELADFAREYGLALFDRDVEPADLADAALIFIATDNEAEDASLSAMARRAGVPVNVVDRPHLSDFAVPALIDRAPVAIAISTDGIAPVLAQRLRAVIEAMLPPHFGRIGELARLVRDKAVQAYPSTADRRRFWHRLFDGAAAEAALKGDFKAAQVLAQDAFRDTNRDGVVWLIGAGPGAPDLLTLRAQRLLQAADVIVHDQLVPQPVIDMGRRDAQRLSVGKAKGRPSMSQAEIDALLVDLARSGRRVARLKAGDPLVFGRAGEEIAALRQAGIRFEIVPGVTAALAAAADAGLSLTLRGAASSLAFVTAHGAEREEPEGWEGLAASGATIAVYMGKSMGGDILRRLSAQGLSATLPVIAVENAGRDDRRILSGCLGDLPALSERDDLQGPVLILIGEAVRIGVSDETISRARVLASRARVLAA